MNTRNFTSFSIDSLIQKSPPFYLGPAASVLDTLSGRTAALCFGMRSPMFVSGTDAFPTSGGVPGVGPEMLISALPDAARYEQRKGVATVGDTPEGFRPYKPIQSCVTTSPISRIRPLIPGRSSLNDNTEENPVILNRLRNFRLNLHGNSHELGTTATNYGYGKHLLDRNGYVVI